MSLENGILGYLSMQPLSGYDIKKLFNMSAAYFWPADQAQIYRSLKRLVDEGSAELKSYSRGETVNKKVYAITDQGRIRMQEWLLSPSESDFIMRSSCAMQLFFSGVLSKEDQLAFLDAQIKANNKLLQKVKLNLEENRAAFIKTAGLDLEDRRIQSAVYTHRWGVLRCEAYAKLLEEIKEEILAKID